MELPKLFQPKEKPEDDAAAIKNSQQFARDSDIIANATHPQDVDYEQFMQKENLMAELTRWQQDLSTTMRELFFNLSGMYEDENGKWLKMEGYTPLMNELGAKRIVDTVKPIDKNVMNGAWSIKQINDAMIAIDDVNVQDIIEHWTLYDIEYSIANMDRICETVITTCYPTFLRGLDNGERRYHGQIQKVIETKNIIPEKKKTGLFGKE